MQKRKGYRREVWDEDTTGLEGLGGVMKKRSRNGAWQKRFFFVNNSYLNYASSERTKHKIKASIDLRRIHADPEIVDRFGHLSLELEDDRIYMLRAETPTLAQQWVDVLTARRNHVGSSSLDGSDTKLSSHNSTTVKHDEDDEVVEFNADEAIAAASKEVTVVLEGTLQKRSPSRYKAWQARDFRLTSSGVLYYYKSANVELNGFLGQIPIDRSCSVNKCAQEELVFYLQTHFRVYTLKAENSESVAEWIAQIQNFIDADSPSSDANEEADSNAEEALEEVELTREPPEWLKQWDLMTEEERFDYLQQRLDAKFMSTKEQKSLLDTLVAATSLLEELDEVAMECMFNCNRYDVLEVYLRVYHTHLEHEIGFFLFSGSFDDSSNHDMLRLMDLITAYDEYLEKVFQGEQGQAIKERFPPITILDHVEDILGRYICDLQIALSTWCENIVNGVFEGADHEEGCFDATASTHAPVDLFNMVNETLTLSKSSGLEKLEAAALFSCMGTVEDYISSVLQRVELIELSTAGGLKFLCALLNDCGSIIEQIDNLSEDYEKLATAYDVKFEPIMLLYDKAAKELTECIARLIFDDISPLTEKLCTTAHFEPEEAGVVEMICATIEDYLNDLERVVERLYFRKLVTNVIHSLMAAYCNQLLAPGRKVGLAVLKKLNGKYVWFLPTLSSFQFEQSHIKQFETDRNRIVDVMHARLFHNTPTGPKPMGSVKVIQPLDHAISFLRQGLHTFPQALSTLFQAEDHECVRTAIVATAFACLSMRADIDKQTINDLASRFKRLRDQLPDASNDLVLDHPYVSLWPALFQSGGYLYLRKDTKTEEAESKVSDAGTPPALLQKNLQKSDPAFVSGRELNRGGAGGKVANKSDKTDATAPYLNLQGYMEKKSPAKNTWQRRWFLLKKGFDDGDKRWKLMLCWHKSHSSKIASWLFLTDVIEIKLGKNVPLQKTGKDGLYKAQGPGKAKAYPFMLITEHRTYYLRAFSVSETLLWVNSLTKAVKEATKQRTSSSATWKQLPIEALKALCRERKVPVPEERDDLVQMLLDNNFQAEVFAQENQIRALVRKGDALLKERDRKAAEQVFDKALRLCQHFGSTAFEARCLEGLGHCYTELPQKAGTSPLMFELAADLYQKVDMVAQSKVCMLKAVDLYHANGDKALAHHCRQKSLSTTEKGGAPGMKGFSGQGQEAIQQETQWEVEEKCA